jgi:hypothetical protein
MLVLVRGGVHKTCCLDSLIRHFMTIGSGIHVILRVMSQQCEKLLLILKGGSYELLR